MILMTEYFANAEVERRIEQAHGSTRRRTVKHLRRRHAAPRRTDDLAS